MKFNFIFFKAAPITLMCLSLMTFQVMAEWTGDISLQNRYFINNPLPVNNEFKQ